MTQEEKLEEAKRLYETANADQKYVLKMLFPELAESEDERIQKVLVGFFKSYKEQGTCGAETFNGLPTDNILAWLEKQGEKKPAFEMKTPEESLGIDSDTYNKIVDECIYGEQKPAWSEEDEKNLQRIIDEIEANRNHAPGYYIATYDKFLSWLKSLKEKVQPKQEWSEEDELRMENILSVIEGHGYPMEVEWLKSLRPQNWTKKDKERYISCLQRLGTGDPKQPETINSKWFKEHVYPQSQWKPSLSQLNALGIVAKGNPPDDIEEIKSLYNDLHKLIN